MAHWAENSDYSVLCCPYFQYPQSKSQIYNQALSGNVLLFSWEYLYLLLDNGIKETIKFSLANCWNQSKHISQNTSIANSGDSFMDRQDEFLKQFVGLDDSRFSKYFNLFKVKIKERGNNEIDYWKGEINRVQCLDREEAIKELLKIMKLNSKIETIQKFIERIHIHK